MKYYEVIFVDEYENWYEVGYFKDLADAEPEVNSYLRDYKLCEDDETDPGGTPEFGENKNLDRLVEYPSTMNMVFDRQIVVEEGCVQVRGFIKDTQLTIDELKKFEGESVK